MDTKDFLCACFRVSSQKVDDITDGFDVDIDESDVRDILDTLRGDLWHPSHWERLGNELIRMLYCKVIGEWSDVLDEDKFDYYLDGWASELKYDGKTVTNHNDLQRIADRLAA